MSGITVVGQSGGVTSVINASLAGVIDVASTGGPVLGMRNGVRGLLEGDLVRLDNLSDTQLHRLRATPGAYLGSCRYALSQRDVETIVDQLQHIGAQRLIYIGGNDSAATSARIELAARGRGLQISVVGVPKTIDNDLPCMDHTPGYASAAAFVALSTRLLWLDTRAMRREEPLRVIEVKGRHSGWLAAACGQFTPEDAVVVLPPEIPLDEKKLLIRVESALRRHGCAIIAVTEHVAPLVDPLAEEGASYADAFGHRDSAAPGAYLSALLERETRKRCRLEILGALQKVALTPASTLDREEAFAVGAEAARAALAMESGVCITLERDERQHYSVRYGRAPLAAIAGSERLIPAEFLDDDGPSSSFRAWLAPLVTDSAALNDDLMEESL
jgi:6-phosphofructokinase